MEPENIWTHLWLEDCLDQGKIAPTQFFHLPITLEPDFKPCKDVVIGKFREIFVKSALVSIVLELENLKQNNHSIHQNFLIPRCSYSLFCNHVR